MSSGWYFLGVGGVPVMLTSAPIVVLGSSGRLWDGERMKCRMGVLWSRSGGGTVV